MSWEQYLDAALKIGGPAALLIAAMGFAVVKLWNKLDKRDEQLTAYIKELAEEGKNHVRVVEANTASMQHLTEAVNLNAMSQRTMLENACSKRDLESVALDLMKAISGRS